MCRVCIYIYICVSISLSLSLHMYIYTHIQTCVYICVHIYIYMYLCMSIYRHRIWDSDIWVFMKFAEEIEYFSLSLRLFTICDQIAYGWIRRCSALRGLALLCGHWKLGRRVLHIYIYIYIYTCRCVYKYVMIYVYI